MENDLFPNAIAPKTSLQLDELILRDAALFAFPVTEWEKRAYTEVISLPRVVVTRPPRDQLLAADMVPYDCHTNCSTQEANDPSRLSRHVFGWMVCGSDLILHSVVKMGSQWLCLTPQLVELAPRFEFVPDARIEWRDADDGVSRVAYRHGKVLPETLRKDPEHHIRMRDELLQLVASGLSVIEARDIVAYRSSNQGEGESGGSERG
ncbi:hypothetical protein ATO67_12525 [Agrobacterium bohemicum]|uniref:Uncharacterized protein n=1 Tax=Agrobacterium bohemicum TaxID=2052828 RepID=A0A135NYV6_9HYPH|nr:hypothetical protein ATO67_12525 [Agrobacterium bohemicum]